MRVICINAAPSRTMIIPPFKEGEILNISDLNDVERMKMYIVYGITDCDNVCIVEEYRYDTDGSTACWMKSRFVPISDIDETEFVRDSKPEESYAF
jgi:hypothetical protein